MLAERDQEREAWRRDRAQLEGGKAALQATLVAQGRLLVQANQEREAGQQEMARIEGRLHEERREHQEHMARVRAVWRCNGQVPTSGEAPRAHGIRLRHLWIC